VSFEVKNGWNEILSKFLFIPVGLFDPVVCKNDKWSITNAIKMNGMRKWSEKNRLRVAFPTENPPHNHSTIIFPKYGIADTRFVMTVAPQNDICPHGNTYPKNAVAIRMNKMEIPDIQTCIDLNEENKNPRLM
jgi:hypothetical protein